MTLMDYAKANVRTIVPFIVGAIITYALKRGVDLHGYAFALTTVVGAVYYAVVRALERYVTPKFGWLLGLAQQPVYAKVSTRKDRPLPRRRTHVVQVERDSGHNRRSVASYNNRSVHDRLALLPPPSGRKGGALPSPRDDRDWKAALPTAIPASCDFGAGLTFLMLLNDRIGDCYPAALLHALQVLTGGRFSPTDADVLHVYEAMGYDPTKTQPDGSNPTDNGTVGRRLFAWAKAHGLITSYAAVPVDRQSIRAAIAGHKAVLCEWALPAGAEREGDIWTMPRSGRAAGSWGGHATVEVGYTKTRNRNVTWGQEGSVTPPFEDAYLQAAWVVEAPAVIPPIVA
jgi:hypothetical protein